MLIDCKGNTALSVTGLTDGSVLAETITFDFLPLYGLNILMEGGDRV